MSLDLALDLLAVLALIVLSAFFAGSETALTGVSKNRLHTLEKEEGNKRAAMVNKIREHKDRMIGALMLGNTTVNILASVLAANVMIRAFGEAGVFYATAIMTVVVLIFAEVIPKTYALHHADGMAMTVAPLVRFFIAVFSPLTNLIARFVRFVFRILGADISKVATGSHMEILRGAIDLHRGPEQEVKEQRAMLRSILDLADVQIGAIMTHRKTVEMIDAALPMEKIIEEALKGPRRIPLYKDLPDNIIGVLHTKALLKELQARGGKLDGIPIESLAAEPWFVPESTTLFDQLQAFRKRREHFALVVDEYGSFMGVVTLEDILEEIVGDIDDEGDKVVAAGVRRQPNGSYLVDGTVTIRDLNRQFEWGLPDDRDYATVAGLVVHEAKMVPDAGRVFHFYDFTFEVVRRQRNQVTLVRLTPPKKTTAGKDEKTKPA